MGDRIGGEELGKKFYVNEQKSKSQNLKKHKKILNWTEQNLEIAKKWNDLFID